MESFNFKIVFISASLKLVPRYWLHRSTGAGGRAAGLARLTATQSVGQLDHRLVAFAPFPIRGTHHRGRISIDINCTFSHSRRILHHAILDIFKNENRFVKNPLMKDS